jgi:hypothetical protein
MFEELFQVTFHRCQVQLLAAGVFGKAAALGPPAVQFGRYGDRPVRAAVFDWVKSRTTKEPGKLHLLLNHAGRLPAYAVITPGKQHEIRLARRLKLPPGSMLVFDWGDTDYDWFATLSLQKIFFVTRLKEQSDFVVVERWAVSPSEAKAGVRQNEILVFRQQATADNDQSFRRVVYWDANKEREFVFLTNHFDLAPSQVAAVYQQRWEGKLFNALKIQIWTDLDSSADLEGEIWGTNQPKRRCKPSVFSGGPERNRLFWTAGMPAVDLVHKVLNIRLSKEASLFLLVGSFIFQCSFCGSFAPATPSGHFAVLWHYLG